ncbi:MAG: hypothetical protein A2283_13660 [Lentisphaerae bacterium RIFOXYA12_FULL_48_11]|nr:MAG: hypothetical protein A2283_13660 [Lentisphaerae bacterium RIFOXYA12_FULL_48_11]
MRITRVIACITMAVMLGLLSGCMAPRTFVRTLEPTWATIELRTDVPYEKAWASLVDSLVKRFDIEVISKEDGYIRTGWLYSWTGRAMETYRVRVTAKFSPDHSKVEVKSEAEYGGPGNWTAGYDTRLLETLKTDIMGNMGRTTR